MTTPLTQKDSRKEDERQRTDRSDADCAEAMKQLREQDDFAVRVKTKDLEQQLLSERQRRHESETIATEWRQQLLSALAAIEKLLREDGHYIECPAPNQETHNFMPNSKDVQRCKALQSVDLSALHEHDAELTQKALCGDIELHQDTKDLVVRFARALAEKLALAEKKYGFTNGWKDADYDELRRKLVEHLVKGDPRDVANFCAFLWDCGESTEDALFEHDNEVRDPLVEALVKARHDAKVWKPLVDALIEARQYCSGAGEMLIDDALAKVKEANKI